MYSKSLQKISERQQQLLMVDGEPLIIPVRVPVKGQYAFIDAMNFVVNVNTFGRTTTNLPANLDELFGLDLGLEDYERLLSIATSTILDDVKHIFGSDFTQMMPTGNGIHGYRHAYRFSTVEGELLLTVGIGGQNNTVFFGLTGKGCLYAKDGWEARLHQFLDEVAVNSKITRIDLAHDDFEGQYSSFHSCNQKESDDAFMLPKARNRPAVRFAGEVKHNDPYDKGLTIYIGNRLNGKLFRGYEKGKQLGDKLSRWFRSEVEIHAKSVFIPLEVLLYPTQFFAGAYPYNMELVDLAKKQKGAKSPQESKRFPILKKQGQISLSRAVEIVQTQFGKYFKVFGELFTKDDKPDHAAIFEMVASKKEDNAVPPRLANALKLRRDESFGRQYIQSIQDKINELKISAQAARRIQENRAAYYSKVIYYDDTKCNFARC